MNIVFFGTNKDGVYFLSKLIKDFDIKVVVTDLIINDNWKRFLARWSFHKILTEDIARWKSNILLIDQAHITKKKFLTILKESNIRLGVVATFGKIIPKEVIEGIPLGIINVHASLLPKYRGANPIFWALRNGEKEFGVTVHYLNEKIDEGDIILQKRIPIADSHTIVDCKKIGCAEGTALLRECIVMLMSGKVVALPQRNEEATYYPPAAEKYRTINIERHSFTEVRRIIRASMDRGGAIFWYNGKKILVKSICKTPLGRSQFIKVHIADEDYFLQY